MKEKYIICDYEVGGGKWNLEFENFDEAKEEAVFMKNYYRQDFSVIKIIYDIDEDGDEEEVETEEVYNTTF